jgi:hypothetical protein
MMERGNDNEERGRREGGEREIEYDQADKHHLGGLAADSIPVQRAVVAFRKDT